MKRLCALLLIMSVILFLCGCSSPVPIETPSQTDASDTTNSLPDDPTETTEASQIQNPTKISQLEDPTENTAQTPEYEGVLGFIARGYQPFEMFGVRLDLSKVYMNLYYLVDLSTGEVTQVFDFPVRYVYECEIGPDECVYYVTMHEPNAVYLYNRTQNTYKMCYKSDVGPITHLTAEAKYKHILNLIVNNQQFVRLDINTGEEDILLEMFYIEHGYFEEYNDYFGEVYVYWVGMQDKDDELDEYVYLIDTSEVKEWPFL